MLTGKYTSTEWGAESSMGKCAAVYKTVWPMLSNLEIYASVYCIYFLKKNLARVKLLTGSINSHTCGQS